MMIMEYVRKNGKLVGVMIAAKSIDDKVYFGWSKYAINKENKPFDKSFALDIAASRADTGRFYAKDDVPFLIRDKYEAFFNRCQKYFKDTPVNMGI